ncbi:MAG TPA: nitrite/sulfite reductase, partial [Polyangiaceae bacterium]|nr:nitrite/sulfite reductase [Polyangiaceae bacterium]
VVATHTQNLVLTDVETTRLPELYQQLKALDIATPNHNLLTDIICCPGLDYCSLANARSIPLSLELMQRFENIDYLNDLGELSIKISGCINACGHHHVGNIGILGIDKGGEEHYQLLLGGSPGNDASVGEILGPAFAKEDIVDAVQRIVQRYLEVRTDAEEPFLACYRRLGEGPFKDAAYANH